MHTPFKKSSDLVLPPVKMVMIPWSPFPELLLMIGLILLFLIVILKKAILWGSSGGVWSTDTPNCKNSALFACTAFPLVYKLSDVGSILATWDVVIAETHKLCKKIKMSKTYEVGQFNAVQLKLKICVSVEHWVRPDGVLCFYLKLIVLLGA